MIYDKIKVYAIINDKIKQGCLYGMTNNYCHVHTDDLAINRYWKIPPDKVSTDPEDLKQFIIDKVKVKIEAAAMGMIREGNQILIQGGKRNPDATYEIVKIKKTRCLCKDIKTNKDWNVPISMLEAGTLIYQVNVV